MLWETSDIQYYDLDLQAVKRPNGTVDDRIQAETTAINVHQLLCFSDMQHVRFVMRTVSIFSEGQGQSCLQSRLLIDAIVDKSVI